MLAGAISDNGACAVLLVEGPRLILLDGALETVADRPAPGDPVGLAVDAHGRFVAVAARSLTTQLYTRHGKPAGSFETMHPLAHLRFVPSRPQILAASSLGSLYAIDLRPERSGAVLECEEQWRAQVMSNIGRLAITGDGGMILASCYTHGIQRFDARGKNEGAYHLGGTAAYAVPDFTGRTIAAATTEGELAILNNAGHIRWRTGLSRGPVSLECDALGRFVVYGLQTGEIVRIDLEGPGPGAATATSASVPRTARGGGLRQPSWTVPVADTEDQAETAVVAVLDEPVCVAVITSRGRLQVFTSSGEALAEAPAITGVGRILRAAPGWIAAATDRQIVLVDARRGAATRLDVSLAELTHLIIRPDTYGLALVQERDRLGRTTSAGRWIWKRELRVPVEDLAVGPDALTAITTEDGQLIVYDPTGAPTGTYQSAPAEPLALASAPAGSPPGVVFLTLARRAQVLRGHRRDARVAWETPVPWEAWQLHALETAVVAETADGRALAFDGSGHPGAQSRAESASGVFFTGAHANVDRVVRQGEHLICADLTSRVHWRSIAPAPIGPLAAGRAGVAAIIGRALAWYPDQPEDDGAARHADRPAPRAS